MKILLASLLCAGAMTLHAAETKNFPASELDIPYSADNPPGPSFTDAQKQVQRKAGLKMLANLRATYASGAGSFTIPPGDYRFGTDWKGADSFVLENFDRDGKAPFRILGHGATLWFDLIPDSAPKVNYMIRLSGCSNITLEGLTIDSDLRGVMEGRITAFDFEGNRIKVEPLKGTQLLTAVPKTQNRFIPYKSDGHHIPALFQIEERGWGPGSMVYKSFTTTEDGKYWFDLDKPVLLQTIRNPTWRKTYGPEGTLEIGDLLCFVWSNSQAIFLDRCKQITVKDCNIYTKSVRMETGYGDNKWLNCRFTPRPGTNNLQGGDGWMSSECEVGSLVDGQVNYHTTDDIANFRAIWRYAEAVGETSITFKKNPYGVDIFKSLARGDKADLYDIKSKRLIGELTVDSVKDRTVTFQEPVGPRYENAGAIFPRFQNNGWVVRNCLFLDCYQRFLILAGEGGIFENNRVERLGGTLKIYTGFAKHIEGGRPDNLVIRDNVFVDSGVTPGKPGFELEGVGRPIRNVSIRGNLICNSGRETIACTEMEGLAIEGNVIINPFKGNPVLPETEWKELPAFTLHRVKGAKIENNLVLRREPGAAIVSEKSCEDIIQSGNRALTDPDGRLETFIRKLTASHESDAKTIIQKVGAEGDALVESTDQVRMKGAP